MKKIILLLFVLLSISYGDTIPYSLSPYWNPYHDDVTHTTKWTITNEYFSRTIYIQGETKEEIKGTLNINVSRTVRVISGSGSCEPMYFYIYGARGGVALYKYTVTGSSLTVSVPVDTGKYKLAVQQSTPYKNSFLYETSGKIITEFIPDETSIRRTISITPMKKISNGKTYDILGRNIRGSIKTNMIVIQNSKLFISR